MQPQKVAIETTLRKLKSGNHSNIELVFRFNININSDAYEFIHNLKKIYPNYLMMVKYCRKYTHSK